MTLRTGAQYINFLKDGREIWYDDKRIADVTEHPAFKGTISHVASLYDEQNDSRKRDLLTHWNEELSQRVGNTYLAPKSSADIQTRRRFIEHWSHRSAGMMGRTGDYVGAMITAWYMNAEFFEDRFSENVRSFYRRCASEDLFLIHALVDPQKNRSKSRANQEGSEVLLKCISENTEGIRVSGVKTIATSAAIADEVIVWPLPVPQTEDEKHYALAFSASMNSPGLKIVCRSSFCPPHRSPADFPLSAKFDEVDAVLVFDNVFVPWEKVFIYDDVERTKRISLTKARELTAHQTNVRLLVKLEFLVGVLNLMAESIGIEKAPPILELLGDCAAHVEQLRALLFSAENQCKVDASGYCYPYLMPLQVGRLMGPKVYPHFINLINKLGGGGLMQIPSSTLQLHGELGKYIAEYCGGAAGNAEERVGLLRLAWDLVGTEFGSRHLLYEIFYSGDPGRLTAAFQSEYNSSVLTSRVREFLHRTQQNASLYS